MKRSEEETRAILVPKKIHYCDIFSSLFKKKKTRTLLFYCAVWLAVKTPQKMWNWMNRMPKCHPSFAQYAALGLLNISARDFLIWMKKMHRPSNLYILVHITEANHFIFLEWGNRRYLSCSKEWYAGDWINLQRVKSIWHEKKTMKFERWLLNTQNEGGVSTASSWWVAEILALQEQVDLTERWPFGRQSSPTLAHQVVNVPGTVLRFR